MYIAIFSRTLIVPIAWTSFQFCAFPSIISQYTGSATSYLDNNKKIPNTTTAFVLAFL